MRQIVTAVFPSFSASFEGRVPWLYLDVAGWVTTGIGNLVDPIEVAMALPWCIGGDPTQPADVDTIAAQWKIVKEATQLERAGGGAFGKLTTIRLTQDAIDTLVRDKALDMERTLRGRFSNWDDLPSDAQLGVLSLSWADGPNFRYPKFAAALGIENFAVYASADGPDGPVLLPGCCAAECGIDPGKRPDGSFANPGVIPRNKANVQLFEAAQRVVDQGLDPDVLHYKDPP